MSNEELKPCPFCGKLPKIYPINPTESGTTWGSVACITLSCPAKPVVHDGAKINDDRGSDKYKRAAIKRWNRRA